MLCGIGPNFERAFLSKAIFLVSVFSFISLSPKRVLTLVYVGNSIIPTDDVKEIKWKR